MNERDSSSEDLHVRQFLNDSADLDDLERLLDGLINLHDRFTTFHQRSAGAVAAPASTEHEVSFFAYDDLREEEQRQPIQGPETEALVVTTLPSDANHFNILKLLANGMIRLKQVKITESPNSWPQHIYQLVKSTRTESLFIDLTNANQELNAALLANAILKNPKLTTFKIEASDENFLDSMISHVGSNRNISSFNRSALELSVSTNRSPEVQTLTEPKTCTVRAKTCRTGRPCRNFFR